MVIFRLFNTVGPRQTGQYGMVIPRFVQQALQKKPLTVYGDGRQTRCFCDVEDTVRAIIRLAECSEAVGQVFNIGSREEVTILDLARKVLSITGDPRLSDLDGRITFIPYDQAYGAGFEDMQRRIPDIKRIKATIGWEPQISLEEVLRRIVESFRLKCV